MLSLGTFTKKLFNNALPECPYQIAIEDFTRPYFFADGIHPRWSVHMTAPQAPSTPAEKKITRKQESVRKDIERAFVVLKARFRILKNPNKGLFVLHNMILFHFQGQNLVEDLLELNIIASEDKVNPDAGLTLVEENKQMVVEVNEEEREERERSTGKAKNMVIFESRTQQTKRSFLQKVYVV